MLILGSLPGAESLKQRRYYAHPQNGFWRIMGAVAGFAPDLHYDARLEALRARRIALWDVCAAATRPGSLDTAIEAPEPNDFAAFFAAHGAIGLICFNGQTAAKLFARLATPSLPRAVASLPRITLPSTSPAHAGMRLEAKRDVWREALKNVIY